jgi:hypothetical protein
MVVKQYNSRHNINIIVCIARIALNSAINY